MVKEAIINALSPVSIAYEDTWKMLSRNVEHCVAKVHHDFARAMNEERQRSHKLSNELAYVKEQRKALREETETIRKTMDIVLRDNGNLKDALTRAKAVIEKNEEELSDLRAEKDSLAMELNIVRHANEQTMEELAKRKGEMEAMDYVDSFVGSMRSEFAKQMDLNLTSLFKDLHEQKTLRIQAEKRLEDAMGKMKAVSCSFPLLRVVNLTDLRLLHRSRTRLLIRSLHPYAIVGMDRPSSVHQHPVISQSEGTLPHLRLRLSSSHPTSSFLQDHRHLHRSVDPLPGHQSTHHFYPLHRSHLNDDQPVYSPIIMENLHPPHHRRVRG